MQLPVRRHFCQEPVQCRNVTLNAIGLELTRPLEIFVRFGTLGISPVCKTCGIVCMYRTDAIQLNPFAYREVAAAILAKLQALRASRELSVPLSDLVLARNSQ